MKVPIPFIRFSIKNLNEPVELRGFAPSGMMEQPNSEMTGFYKTEFKAHNFTVNILL